MERMVTKNEKLYMRILRAFVILVAVVIVLTAALLYMTSDSIVTNLTYRNNLQTLKESYNRIQSGFAKAYTLTNMIYSDPDVSYALNDETFQANKLMRTVHRLNAYREMESSIYSIYVYNGNTQEVMVSGPRHGSIENKVFGVDADFFDTGLKDIIQNLSRYNRGMPIARVIQTLENSEITSYEGYTSFFSQGYDPTHISNVFVNYTVDLFELQQSEGMVTLIDDDGRVIASNCYSMGYDMTQHHDMWHQLTDDVKENDSFRVRYDGEDVLVTYLNVRMDNSWKLIKVVPFSQVSTEIDALRRLVLLITILVFAIGIVATWITSRFIYVPIHQINQELDQANEENVQLRFLSRQQAMRRLMVGDIVDDERLADMLSFVRGKTLRIVYMRCLNHNAIRREMNVTDYQDWVRSIVNRMENELRIHFYVIGVDFHSGREFAFALAGNAQQMSDDMILSQVAVAQGHVEEASGASMQMTLSPTYTDLMQCTQMFSQLQDASFRSMCLPEIHRAFMDQISAPEDDLFDYQTSKENQLSSMMLGEQFDQVAALTREILEQTFGCSFYIVDMTVARLTFVYISVLKLLYSRFGTQQEIVLPDQFHLSHMEDPKELYDYFDGLLQRVIDVSREKKSNRTQDIVHKVNDFLAENLGDCTINLDAVAEPIGMSAAYVSRIYKLSSGMTISEALNRLRINKAKELLRSQKQLTVAQIAEITGFTSNTYFSRAFKRDTGMTPNEYRNAQYIDA